MNGLTQKKRNKDRLGFFIISMCFVAMVVFSVIVYWVNTNRVEIDQKTLCPNDGIRGFYVILVDRTDPFSNLQLLQIRNILKNTKENIPIHYQLSIYTMGQTGGEKNIKHEISLCNPGDGSDKNPFIANPKLIKKRWIDDFSNVLDHAIDNAVSTDEDKFSPIMESIREISINEFDGSKKAKMEKKLVIVSDMMQNNNEISHYKNISTFSSFLSNPTNIKYIPDLNNTNVKLLYLTRDKLASYQNKKHIIFWQQYFHEANGSLVSVKRIAN